MSVQTTADERLEFARDSVQDAIEHLSKIVIEKCEGSDDFNETRQASVVEALHELLLIRKKLE